MLIHVQQGKGARDRELPLTQKVLDALRQYGRAAKIKPRVYAAPRRPTCR
jgi:site-specific recombinase XerC